MCVDRFSEYRFIGILGAVNAYADFQHEMFVTAFLKSYMSLS